MKITIRLVILECKHSSIKYVLPYHKVGMMFWCYDSCNCYRKIKYKRVLRFKIK